MRLLILVLMSLLALNARAAAQTPSDPPSIVVSGEGIMKAAPDQAWVRVATESRSKVSKDAQQRNAEVMTAVQQKLTALGLTKDAVKTVGVDLQPEFDYNNGRQTMRGYVARNTIEVRIDDFTKVGDVLDAAVASGATNVHGLRFDVKDRTRLERAALQQAVRDASEKAAAVAAGINRGVDRVLRVEELFTGRGGGPQPVMMMERSAMAKAMDTPIEAGEIEIHAQVRLTAAIK